MTNKIRFLFFAAFILFLTPSCTKTNQETSKEVNLAIWNNYISPELLQKFTANTGIKVNVTTYASNEELLAKVQSGASGLDVAVPSDYMVDVMRKLTLLEKIDAAKVPNSKNVSDFLLKQDFDPANEYSYPYSWTTTGIAINTELFKGKIESWKDFFSNNEISGKVSMLDDVREVLAAALKLEGQSVNSTDQAQIEKATDELLKMKKKLKMFRSEAVDSLMNNEVAVAQAFSSDALQVEQKTKGKIKFILPSEGGSQAVDNVVILKGSKNLAEAHDLINYLLSSEVNVEFVKTVMGGPVLKTTRQALPQELANKTSLFPEAAQLAKFEKIKDLGDNVKLYEKAWTKIKTE